MRVTEAVLARAVITPLHANLSEQQLHASLDRQAQRPPVPAAQTGVIRGNVAQELGEKSGAAARCKRSAQQDAETLVTAVVAPQVSGSVS